MMSDFADFQTLCRIFLHLLNFQLLINMVGGGGNATQGNSSKVSRLARVVLGTNRNSGDFLEEHIMSNLIELTQE